MNDRVLRMLLCDRVDRMLRASDVLALRRVLSLRRSGASHSGNGPEMQGRSGTRGSAFFLPLPTVANQLINSRTRAFADVGVVEAVELGLGTPGEASSSSFS